jgi:hypothetical protein
LSDFVKIEHFQELVNKGYLVDDSNLLASCKQVAIPETERETEREVEKKIQKKENRFDEFWRLYPKQRAGSKEKARAAYEKAIKRASEDEIIEGCEAYSKSSEVLNGYAKGAAAWLNDDRWASDYAIIPRKESKPSHSDEVNWAKQMAHKLAAS